MFHACPQGCDHAVPVTFWPPAGISSGSCLESRSSTQALLPAMLVALLGGVISFPVALRAADRAALSGLYERRHHRRDAGHGLPRGARPSLAALLLCAGAVHGVPSDPGLHGLGISAHLCCKIKNWFAQVSGRRGDRLRPAFPVGVPHSAAGPRGADGGRRHPAAPLWAPMCLGLAFAFGWTPCIGPQLGAILSLAASEASVSTRHASCWAFTPLGLGVPFLLAAMFLNRSMTLMNKSEAPHGCD